MRAVARLSCGRQMQMLTTACFCALLDRKTLCFTEVLGGMQQTYCVRNAHSNGGRTPPVHVCSEKPKTSHSSKWKWER